MAGLISAGVVGYAVGGLPSAAALSSAVVWWRFLGARPGTGSRP